MKRLSIITLTTLFCTSLFAQEPIGWLHIEAADTVFTDTVVAEDPIYTKQFSDAKLVKKAEKWAKKGKWKNGFTKGEPDVMVNLTEFYLQYTKNKAVWKQLFNWLETTDLLTIPAGKHNIEGSNLIASVEDSHNDPLEKRKSESHRKNIDFMFVVRGIEGFLRLDHNTSTENTEYKPDVVRYAYDKDMAEYIESTPGHFIIMFPDDWHVAKVKTGRDDQNIRVIVVKMPVAE